MYFLHLHIIVGNALQGWYFSREGGAENGEEAKNVDDFTVGQEALFSRQDWRLRR